MSNETTGGAQLQETLEERRVSRRNLLLSGTTVLATAGLQAASAMTQAHAQQPADGVGATSAHPNIVVVMADNLGYGELGCYGGGVVRGAPTPRLDALAAEGTRLTNFNVEPSCTPSRSAFMTGRHPIRSGTYSVPTDGKLYGLVQWEITIAELLSRQGYATGHYGKWHLGDSEGRYPTDQGFDEWFGIPNSSDESLWPHQPDFDPAVGHFEYVMAGERGQQSTKLELYDNKARREMDHAVTDHAIDFMKRSVKAAKPFFAYVPLTQPHMPTETSSAFDGKTGNGPFADMLAEMDFNVGRMIDAVSALGIQNDTIFIFTSDNGPEDTLPWRGWAGPWSGSYVTAMEGSLRVPFIARWPGKIPAGRLSNEIVHITDLFTTFANVAGASIPSDRGIDGLDQSAFLLGKQEKSSREWFPVFQAIGATGPQLYAMKWRNYKMHLIWQVRMFDPPKILAVPWLIDLYDNPTEQIEETTGESALVTHGWIAHAMFGELAKFQASLKRYPPIAPGASDPYSPPKS